FTSNVTLLELSNTNNEVLRKLSEEAPGTFQHVLQVSNLSADIAAELGANALLARTGALYHDIGKMKNPAFFTENQHKGINPHSQLRPEQSAHVIIDHIKNGVDIARQNALPQCIVDIIKTHHGKSKTRYFYNTWINNNPGKPVDESRFTYDGPNPATLEQGIVMICDSIEAASRSLPEYTDESINNLVENIVGSMVSNHYLDNTPIKMNQIQEIKEILKDKLKNIYHTRIAYPELKNPQ
ncbi:MAG: HDIG domain-containing protein, partial [Paludibacteraceae bacterium]|nr:HDIG domain-containing protein [Paludibacteraceae bacterium]